MKQSYVLWKSSKGTFASGGEHQPGGVCYGLARLVRRSLREQGSSFDTPRMSKDSGRSVVDSRREAPPRLRHRCPAKHASQRFPVQGLRLQQAGPTSLTAR
ncbi:hypothetical protein LIA77_01712 [Sarocladium implicatum]|nr:hypothetical protein LIA77_01712 [Sarocladium implicatum]